MHYLGFNRKRNQKDDMAVNEMKVNGHGKSQYLVVVLTTQQNIVQRIIKRYILLNQDVIYMALIVRMEQVVLYGNIQIILINGQNGSTQIYIKHHVLII